MKFPLKKILATALALLVLQEPIAMAQSATANELAFHQV